MTNDKQKMASKLILEPSESIAESSNNLQFSQIEERILRWLDKEKIIMTEPGNSQNLHRGSKSKIQLTSKLFLSRMKKN